MYFALEVDMSHCGRQRWNVIVSNDSFGYHIDKGQAHSDEPPLPIYVDLESFKAAVSALSRGPHIRYSH